MQEQGQEILLTLNLLNRRPFLLFAFLFPSPWSLNPNGKRSFHVNTRGAWLLSSEVFVFAKIPQTYLVPTSKSNTC